MVLPTPRVRHELLIKCDQPELDKYQIERASLLENSNGVWITGNRNINNAEEKQVAYLAIAEVLAIAGLGTHAASEKLGMVGKRILQESVVGNS